MVRQKETSLEITEIKRHDIIAAKLFVVI